MTDSVLEQQDSLEARGSLEVRGRAIERIAKAAATAVDGVRDVPGTLTSRGLPHVEASVVAGHCRVTIDAATQWPRPIARLAEQIRAAVAADLTRQGGVVVDAVDVTVSYSAPAREDNSTRRVQ